MARRPIEDERILVPERKGRSGGRVFITDLAAYLGHREGKLKRFAREHGLLHKASRGAMRPAACYVTDEGAMRLIAVFRTQLGAALQERTQYTRTYEYRLRELAAGRKP